MPIGMTTTQLVSITAATGSITATVDNSQRYHRHRFWFEIGAAATCKIQGSYDGSTWFDIKSVTTDGEVKNLLEPFKHLRVDVSGNTGTTKINVEQFYSNQTGAF